MWWSVAVVSGFFAWMLLGMMVFVLSDKDGRMLEWFEADPAKPFGQILMMVSWPIVILIALIVRQRRRRGK